MQQLNDMADGARMDKLASEVKAAADEQFRGAPDMATDPEIENWFSYHPPFGNQKDRYVLIRDAAKNMAYIIRAFTPKNPDQTVALRKLRECVMTANAAIACGEPAGVSASG